ncbi:MAG: hypothetical protein NC205_03500 [Prevotella sp.]|nr:hypothetical protein [Alistipes senegalensis]MCM1357634.1 hypothetical protein [Prevotella sp.]MCM1474529.1 hypothetical protein [Muribaculaceae bacterium]
MKTTKLILGILTIVISCFVLFQSCAAGTANALSNNGESSGTGGALVSLLMLAGGITMIVSRKSSAKGGSIAGVIIFGISALIGFTSAGSVFKDLIVWAVLCVILAVINLIAVLCCKSLFSIF